MLRRILLGLACGIQAAQAAQAPSAAAIQAAIAHRGARAEVAALFNSGAWDAVTARIAAAQPDYLALVPLLAEGADAGPAEDLGISLAYALPRAPAAVLRLTENPKARRIASITPARVCGLPFIENTMPENYVRDTEAALARVSSAAVASSKQACLKILKNAAASTDR